MDELADDFIMNLDGLRKANRLPRQPLNARSEVQVLPLDALGRAFSDQVFVLRQVALIRLPPIGTVQGHIPRFDQG